MHPKVYYKTAFAGRTGPHSRIYQLRYNKNKREEYFLEYHIITETLILDSKLVLLKQAACLFYLSLLEDPTSERIIPSLTLLHVIASETSRSCQKPVTLKITARYYIEYQVKKISALEIQFIPQLPALHSNPELINFNTTPAA